MNANLVERVHGEQDDPRDVQGFDDLPGDGRLPRRTAATQTCDTTGTLNVHLHVSSLGNILYECWHDAARRESLQATV